MTDKEYVFSSPNARQNMFDEIWLRAIQRILKTLPASGRPCMIIATPGQNLFRAILFDGLLLVETLKRAVVALVHGRTFKYRNFSRAAMVGPLHPTIIFRIMFMLDNTGPILTRENNKHRQVRPLELRRKRRRKIERLAMFGTRTRLADAVLAQRNIDPTGETVAEIPPRFPVTNQDKRRHRDGDIVHENTKNRP